MRSFLILALAGAAVVAASVQTPAKARRSTCAPTLVSYQSAKHPTLGDMPWVLAQPSAPGILGFVVSYPQTLRDRRVNRSDGLVLWRSGARIVWSGASSATTLVGRRLDGRGSFRSDLVASRDGLVSEPRFPSAGCWRLSVGREATVVARVVPRPTKLGCDATPLTDGGALARPRSSRIRGAWGPWRTPSGGALLYTHGHGAGLNMKVPWWIGRGHGPSLNLSGTRLDAAGSFTQEFPMAISPEGVFPSTVDVPAAGCWLLRLRTGRLAGVLVVQAIDDRG